MRAFTSPRLKKDHLENISVIVKPNSVTFARPATRKTKSDGRGAVVKATEDEDYVFHLHKIVTTSQPKIKLEEAVSTRCTIRTSAGINGFGISN